MSTKINMGLMEYHQEPEDCFQVIKMRVITNPQSISQRWIHSWPVKVSYKINSFNHRAKFPSQNNKMKIVSVDSTFARRSLDQAASEKYGHVLTSLLNQHKHRKAIWDHRLCSLVATAKNSCMPWRLRICLNPPKKKRNRELPKNNQCLKVKVNSCMRIKFIKSCLMELVSHRYTGLANTKKDTAWWWTNLVAASKNCSESAIENSH